MAFVLKATYDGSRCIQIDHEKFVPGIGWCAKSDFVYTEPVGNWTELIFKANDDVKYIDFLMTMVYKNLEVWRKLSMLILHEYQEENTDLKHFAVDCIELLDHTFEAPKINLNCRWQCELLDHLTTSVSTHVISTCLNKRRLKRYFYEMLGRLMQ